ncbi:MazG family protein [uncultured Cellulomonas sp.]|uniref:MazG family protein n=1 Tax=uncultured Cellulomonas sp. TaxID=189682 RepID=UPI0026371459|nr:MazG family protein [uncultured Cellulomonas sp.]
MTPDAVGPQVAAAGAAGDGAGVRRLVEVMDTLRSPGGCPWDARQSHRSLVPYLLEESHELAEAIENDDRVEMREELGDVLLQVVFHARVAQEHPTDPFDLDDVADGLTAKLVRRHPHVFAADSAADDTHGAGGEDAGGDLHVRWDRIKKAEKARTSVLDGVPLAQGALSRAAKVLARAERAGLVVDVDRVADQHTARSADGPAGEAAAARIGARLLRLVAEAGAAGVDAEAALRAASRTAEATIRALETG